jgi:DNA-binding transcriptional MerR regulator
MTEALTVRQTADRLGISPHALRYYEAEGLLGNAVERDALGHRRYPEQTILWLRLLLCLRDTGMPLAEIKAFVALAQEGAHTLAEQLDRIRRFQARVAENIRQLQQAQQQLHDKAQWYERLLAEDRRSPAWSSIARTLPDSGEPHR